MVRISIFIASQKLSYMGLFYSSFISIHPSGTLWLEYPTVHKIADNGWTKTWSQAVKVEILIKDKRTPSQKYLI